MPTSEQITELIRGLSHSHPGVRTRSAKELGKIGSPAKGAFSLLVAAAEDPVQSVRETAVLALSGFGAEAVASLIPLVQHPDKYVRRNAIWALGKIGPPAASAIAVLCQALRDEDPRSASGAAQSLGCLGELGAPAISALTEAMRGTNVVLCRLAAKALSEIGRPAIPTLVQHLRHHDPFVRGEAAVALGWMGPRAEKAVPALVEMLGVPLVAQPIAPAGRPVAGAVVTLPKPAAAKSAETTTLDIARSYAAQALGRIGPAAAAAVPALMANTEDANEQVRLAAEQALRLIS
jgi:HEAT repeat protein